MTTMREAAQQALEAMESVEWYGAGSGWMVDADAIEGAITALRAALAEPPTNQCGETCERAKLCAVCARGVAEPQEPVAWIYADPDKFGVKFLEWREDAFGYEGEWIKTPLYTAPPQRKPLSEKEVFKLLDYGTQYTRVPEYAMNFVRAIERAHGIGGTNESA